MFAVRGLYKLIGCGLTASPSEFRRWASSDAGVPKVVETMRESQVPSQPPLQTLSDAGPNRQCEAVVISLTEQR